MKGLKPLLAVRVLLLLRGSESGKYQPGDFILKYKFDSMQRILKELTGNYLVMFLLIFVFSVFFYSYKIGFSDLWSDEIYTKSMLSGSPGDFYAMFKNDLHPPLYYIGLRVYTALTGQSPEALRAFSVIGVLATLLLGYFAGQRIFGKQGAIWFCLLLISVPMLAVYSHQARMYTWAAFSVTGVFIYSCLFLRTGATRDLVFLVIFTLAAAFLHYYSMIAAFTANLFVFLHLVFTRNKRWLNHVAAMLVTALMLLPWLSMFLVQFRRVQHAFWAPGVSLSSIATCFAIPFTEQFWVTGFSKVFSVLMYVLVVVTIILSFRKSFSGDRLAIWLSLFIFLGTLSVATIVSLFSQPILYSRYVVVIVLMLIVPVTILLTRVKPGWLRVVLLPAILFLGIRTSVNAFGFSYGPYKQTIEYISRTYPEIKKLLHLTEVTAGPLTEYNGNSGLTHYWLKAEMSNVDAFTAILQYTRPDEFLEPGERFLVTRFHTMDLNQVNMDLILSESELIRTDTVFDRKAEGGIFLQLYLLEYKGRHNRTQ